MIMYFSLNTEFGVGARWLLYPLGMAVFWILPHSGHLSLGNFRWIRAGLSRVEL